MKIVSEANIYNATESLIECKICGRKLALITPSHLAKHGITIEEYRKKYPDAPLMSKILRKARSEITKRLIEEGKIPAYGKGQSPRTFGMLGKKQSDYQRKIAKEMGKMRIGPENPHYGKQDSEEACKRIGEAIKTHNELVLEYAKKFEDMGYRVIVPGYVRGYPCPDLILVKGDAKIYAVEVTRIGIDDRYEGVNHPFDDIIWIVVRKEVKKDG